MFRSLRSPDVLITTLAAAGILLVTMGARQSMGLFVSLLNTATGLGIATISLAMAVAQFAWGAIQPVAGAVADRHGAGPVLVGALLLLALGSAITPFMDSGLGLVVTIGLMSAMGSGAASFSVLIGAAAQRMPAEARGTASGVINAGGSFGQFLFAPILQKLIQTVGWMGAMWGMALMTLAALLLIRRLTRPVEKPVHHAETDHGVMRAIRDAMKDRSYLLLHLGFFTCGFHIAFLRHPPAGRGRAVRAAPHGGELVAGDHRPGQHLRQPVRRLLRRALPQQVRAGRHVRLARALLVGWYLMMPSSEWTFYFFAAGLGFTWLATVPPTAAIVGKLFGVRYLGTLFGLTLLSHQTGGFLGAWLGGLAVVEFGDFSWMWYADMAPAALAAVINLPIREAPVERKLATA